MEDGELKAILEALIFAAEAPLSVERIKEVLEDVPKKDLQRLIAELAGEYSNACRGFTLVEVAEGWQFRTRPEYAAWIKKLRKTKAFSLSQAALETLAIIAYKQPVIRLEIEKIRGVDSGGVLRTLLEKKLIRILGRKDIPGRPLVYGTSRHFLELFGLKDLTSLPTLKEMESLGAGTKEGFLAPLNQGAEANSLSSENPQQPPEAETNEPSC